MPTIRLRLATADQIRGWSCGEVTRPDLLDGATGRPVPGGLACEAIFGPTEDHTCRCGRRHTPPPPGVAAACPDCSVPLLPRRARRERFGHIELAAPVPHPWYLRRGSPTLALLLGLPATTVRGILAGSVAVVAALNRDAITQLIRRERAALDEELAAIAAEIAALVGTTGSGADTSAPGTTDELRREAEALMAAVAARRALLERLRPGSLLAYDEARALGTALGAGLEIATGGAGLACLLDRLDLAQMEARLRATLATADDKCGDGASSNAAAASPGSTARLRRRLRAVALLRRGGTPPGALLLRALPVLPPDLRPVIDAGAHLIASDLNALYAGVLAQNARLRRLRAAGAPAIVLAHAERGLQRAVAALLDNARQPRPATPRSAGRAAGGGRPLVDLSARLGGKAGRFRGHLLGKRVDYSGRAVIVPGPALALDECGLPWDLALELFAPFVARELLAARAVATPRAARRAIARREAAVWPALERAAAGRLVLLNRAPTLHRLSLRAFRSVLVAGGAIRIHPLVTKGFNADFDGDQMAVHLPLSAAAQEEARRLMLPSRGLRAPANGGTTLVPQQEIVLGLHYLTLAGAGPGAGERATPTGGDRPRPAAGDGHRYWRPEDALVALDHGATTIGARCRVLLPADWGGDGRTWVPATPGRLLFNAALPPELRFRDGAQGDGSLRALLAACQEKLGDAATVALAERLTDLGYRWATRGGLSIGVGDAPVPPERGAIIAAARREEAAARADEARGLLAREELPAALAAAWDGARRALAAAIRRDLAPQNPLAMAIDSGARGKLAQVTQLAGLRGLVQDLRGRTIPFPIAASYREGLTALEYVVACRGARKGFADRSLNTAPAGYLTRRLVLAAQDAVAGEEDCGTGAGLPVTLPGPDASEEDTAAARAALLGRVLATDVAGIARAGKPLAAATVELILNDAPGGAAIVRSPLTCAARRGVCRRCYGADPATGELVAAGAAIGVVAAQAVGEPGTQLTMTTFHLGGVALGGDITSGLPRVEELLEARRPRGCAPLAPMAGRVTLHGEGGSTIVAIRDPETGACREVALPAGRVAVVAEGQAVEAGEPLAAGPLDPRELARLRGTLAAQHYLIAAIQAVYRREGVAIDDRHLETIARQLARLVRVTAPGDSGLLPGELLDSGAFIDATLATLAEGGAPPLATPELVGLTEAARHQPSFLAAAAFERATSVLAEAALAGREDDLSATNARVLLGVVVPCWQPGRAGHAAQSLSGMCREYRADDVSVNDPSPSAASIATAATQWRKTMLTPGRA